MFGFERDGLEDQEIESALDISPTPTTPPSRRRSVATAVSSTTRGTVPGTRSISGWITSIRCRWIRILAPLPKPGQPGTCPWTWLWSRRAGECASGGRPEVASLQRTLSRANFAVSSATSPDIGSRPVTSSDVGIERIDGVQVPARLSMPSARFRSHALIGRHSSPGATTAGRFRPDVNRALRGGGPSWQRWYPPRP